jgi:uncharacterized membrane protein
MIVLALGLLIFFGAHAVPMTPALAHGLPERERKLAVALGSAVGLALIVWGKAQAPLEPLWAPPPWGRGLAHALMPLAFILVAAAYVPRNHIRPLVRNPMLAGVILWSIAHLAANGDLASLLLFGGFLLFAVVDWWSLTRRPSTAAAGTLTGDAVAVVAGLAAFTAVLLAHPYLFGVAATG